MSRQYVKIIDMIKTALEKDGISKEEARKMRSELCKKYTWRPGPAFLAIFVWQQTLWKRGSYSFSLWEEEQQFCWEPLGKGKYLMFWKAISPQVWQHTLWKRGSYFQPLRRGPANLLRTPWERGENSWCFERPQAHKPIVQLSPCKRGQSNLPLRKGSISKGCFYSNTPTTVCGCIFFTRWLLPRSLKHKGLPGVGGEAGLTPNSMV